MSTPITVFKTLLRRELWEHKRTFIALPVAIGGLSILAALCVYLFHFVGKVHFWGNVTFSADAAGLRTAAFGAAEPFMLVLWLTVFYYFLGTLYDDRKDGSILFWQSLPISQTQTLLSKLVTGLIVAPIATWVCMVVTQVILLCIASLFLMSAHIFSWTSLWQPITLGTIWIQILFALFTQMFWLLPLFAWCLFCSAFAKKAPALRAIIIVLALMIIGAIVLENNFLSHFVFSRFAFAMQAWNGLIDQQHNLLGFLVNVEKGVAIISGLVVSVVFIGLAGYLRSKCYSFEK
jgi:ABC-2 type transport system permease protein